MRDRRTVTPRIGVDIGGTFTDLAAVDAEGNLHISKQMAASARTPAATADTDLDPLTTYGNAFQDRAHAHGVRVGTALGLGLTGPDFGTVGMDRMTYRTAAASALPEIRSA